MTLIRKTLVAATLGWMGQAVLAAAPWDPVAAGFYGPEASAPTVQRYFENWKSIMTAPVCDAQAVDRKHVSAHAVQGLQLGDLCLLPADVRKVVTSAIDKAMSSDNQRLQEAIAKARSEGKLKDWERELNQKHLKMLKQGGGVGWVTQEFTLGGEDRISAEISTFLPTSRRAYVSWVRKTSCAASKDDTLDAGGAFYRKLEAEYGQPSNTISESQFRAQQYEQRLVDARKLADKNEAAAKTEEEQAAVKLLRQEIVLLEKIKEKDAARKAGPGNPAMAHQWDFDGYVVSINRSGECEGERPRYVMRLSIHGAKKSLFEELGQASLAQVRKVRDTAGPRK